MNLDKRVEKNITSINNLRSLLMEVIKNPHDHLNDPLLLDSLVSQGKLSKYQNKELNIYSTSINTMKRLSVYPNCDFEELDKLRIIALEKINTEKNNKNKTTYNRKDLSDKIKSLENELNINKNSQLLLLKIINEINKTLKSVNNVSNIEEIKEHLGLISNKIKRTMSLNVEFLSNNEGNNVISHNFKKKV